MIDRESLLNDKEFLKSFKDGADLQQFFKELHGRCISNARREMDGHLGYDKYARSEEKNSRNGHMTKKVRGDQEGSFNPILVPKRKISLIGV